MHVGWICVKHGLPKCAPLRCARHVAVTLQPMALVERKKTLPYPPVARTTASARWVSMSPVTMSRATMPRARPSTTINSSISCRENSVTVPAATCRPIAW